MEFDLDLVELFVPIGICVVLPIAIVAIIFSVARNKDNKHAQIMLAAIDKDPNLDFEKLAKLFGQSEKTPMSKALANLRNGLIFIAIGISLIATNLFNDYDNILCILGCGSLLIGVAFVIMYNIYKKEALRQENLKSLPENNEEI